MNVIVKTERPGFVENGWVGHELGIGDGVRLNVALLGGKIEGLRLRPVEPHDHVDRIVGRWQPV